VKLLPEDIDSLLSRSRQANCATVFFSHPLQDDFTVLTQDLVKPVEYVPSFIFKPFVNNDVPEIIIHPTHKNEEVVKYLNSFPQGEFWEMTEIANVESTSFKEYSEAFIKYQDTIKSGSCSKAVLSTVVKHKVPDNFSYGNFILKLRKEYPGAFVYLFSAPFAGTWLGATPETLLKWEENEVRTMSLAGTRNYSPGSVFGAKEITEQEFVTSYIEQCFLEAFGSYNVAPLEELKYGNLVHLISRVSAHVPGTFNKELFLNLAANLHPTPAVGGTPKNRAMELISVTEGHPRFYYSGYLGTINHNSAGLYVNLRCMTIAQNNMFIFAGGGITKDSQLESEWRETRLKADTLLKFI